MTPSAAGQSVHNERDREYGNRDNARGIRAPQRVARSGIREHFAGEQSIPAKVYKKTAANDGKSRLQRAGRLAQVGSTARQVALGNQRYAAEQAALAAGGAYVAKKAEKIRLQRGKPKKRMTGPVFWLMVTIAVLKDTLDLLFTFTVVFSLFSTLFGIIVALTILFYMVLNQVPFTTRKVVSFALSTIVEIIPFAAVFPLTTLNLFLVRYFDNSEIVRKWVEKKYALIA